MPCCSFLFWWRVSFRRGYIIRKRFLLEEVGTVFEDSERLFEKLTHILEKRARILEGPVCIRTSERHIRKKPVLLENGKRSPSPHI